MQFYILVSQLRFPSNAGALIEYMSVIYFHFEFVKGQTRLQKMTKLPKYISTGNFHDFLVNLGIWLNFFRLRFIGKWGLVVSMGRWPCHVLDSRGVLCMSSLTQHHHRVGVPDFITTHNHWCDDIPHDDLIFDADSSNCNIVHVIFKSCACLESNM